MLAVLFFGATAGVSRFSSSSKMSLERVNSEILSPVHHEGKVMQVILSLTAFILVRRAKMITTPTRMTIATKMTVAKLTLLV